MTLSQRINGWLRPVPAWPLYILTAIYTVWMFYLAATGQMGVEPINTLEREYGEMALKLLIAGLIVTPLRTWTGVNLVKFRRAIGLCAFFLVLAHFLVFAILDVQSLGRVVTEVIERPYVTVGFVAFVLLIPLAVTSNNRSIRKLGPVRWRNLHKLTYPVAVLSGLHYVWLVKGWPIEPFAYMAVILALLVLRLKWTRIRGWFGAEKGDARA
ncbi:protein-methionine-sulfoxide reductase heme-binding subunit MsrQ [Salipiger sp. IMCC34102]|uniref:protein-methionine-sulfoxide reductase heme-binding subunit MsrQ n=1 Tax=Salipiger sp. IMCC34102 TaxID=2510647 RepID=UPI00101CBE29|nr:protein-methionine-sulfoxide reductase heme-binding subunit MsrQ [Salipiger sp. IMCC34102]RYH01514.1 protein-methionine-sulfoxide reductase heme-binding subunit MsrQ [Salipiger sp. IMCC34102]